MDEDTRRIYAAAYDSPEAIRAGNRWYQTMRRDVADLAGYAPVTMPVLTLAGEDSYPVLREQMADKGTDVRVVAVPGSGHYIPEEQPEFLLAELTAFFDRDRGV
ncbi:alpha/beta fold hydrolase [Nocardia cyriacigeorgica]|uniref:alpha/beta fold hydrolase n=1 Tax=Nocardia cyriacigeorgica TaxID=135487 RepID=UPI001E36E5AC|nr:alpha/beta hydrolase [Nocardia cyriacigeorgica]